jgi:CheY-like chemotaxis protein
VVAFDQHCRALVDAELATLEPTDELKLAFLEFPEDWERSQRTARAWILAGRDRSYRLCRQALARSFWNADASPIPSPLPGSRDTSFLNDSRSLIGHQWPPLEHLLMSGILSGLRILILEDEFLIAMDVEQLCRDSGATDITIKRTVAEIQTEDATDGFDVAIVDFMLSGVSTMPFAQRLHSRGRPFVITSGYVDSAEVSTALPGIGVVGKPFSGPDLVEAVAAAAGRR